MAFPEELVRYKAAKVCDVCGERFVLSVMRSGGGFFVGTECCEGPNSRESEYYASRDDVLVALAMGTVEWRQVGFQGGALEVIEIPQGADVADFIQQHVHRG
jgi:hypothetical protein